VTPGLLRRLASLLYEVLLLAAVAFFAGSLFLFASGGQDATAGWHRAALQAFLALAFAAYFLWCWLRGGQTLPMKAWKIRLVGVTPQKAVLRLAIAALLLPFSVLWALFDKDGQFLHDRLAGTRLIVVQPTTS
jgi:uncharacterized RDD family membrane protein YckC